MENTRESTQMIWVSARRYSMLSRRDLLKLKIVKIELKHVKNALSLRKPRKKLKSY
jgi:hypothetical protein